MENMAMAKPRNYASFTLLWSQ